jgi:hypothetical protein
MPIEYSRDGNDRHYRGICRHCAKLAMRHLVTGRRRLSYSCNLHRNAPNIGHCEHPNVLSMRAWHRGNRPFVRLNVRLGSTAPSNDRCQRRCGTTAVGRSATVESESERPDPRQSQFDPSETDGFPASRRLTRGTRAPREFVVRCHSWMSGQLRWRQIAHSVSFRGVKSPKQALLDGRRERRWFPSGVRAGISPRRRNGHARD